MEQFYFHLFADGDNARDFIICEADFYYQFNLVAICAYFSGASVLAFSIEDTHPHFLLFGTKEQATRFKLHYRTSTLQHIRCTRKTSDGVNFDLFILKILDINHLMNVGSYVIIQATKDGKHIMPYDYKWGTGSMYFRETNYIPIWCIGNDGEQHNPLELKSLSYRQKMNIAGTRIKLPDNWLVCNGLILPQNYVDVNHYESIFKTHNCFRVYTAGNKKLFQSIKDKVAEYQGITIEDSDARKICISVCERLFQKKTSRWLTGDERFFLAKTLRDEYKLSKRQLATLCRIPEIEIEKYIE